MKELIIIQISHHAVGQKEGSIRKNHHQVNLKFF